MAIKLLLHTCCAPCLIYPYSFLRDQGKEVTAFFYNPNVHPFLEFRKRRETLEAYTENQSIRLISEKQYGLTDFLRKVVFQEKNRCEICYLTRLEKTILFAKKLGFESFSTTLLYSKYQQHDLIASLCNRLSIQHNISFCYNDFRAGWQEGVDKAVEQNIYRQSYCGCIYSEHERYDKSIRKQVTKHQ